MTVEPFQLYHLKLLHAQGVQPAQARQVSHLPASYDSVARLPGLSMTVRHGEDIVLCGGVLPTAPNMGLLWAVLSAQAGAHMVWLHRATRRFLEINPPRRIEATVEDGFPAGCRWLEMLGFEFEGRMRAYGMDGETHLRYAKVR